MKIQIFYKGMKNKLTFGLIGCGYISEKHYKAIKYIGGELTHIYDVHDSVGVIDRYFRNAKFCTSEEEFFSCETDYKVICSPNYLHVEHINKSYPSKVICEKPLCLSSDEIREINGEVYCILQLRLNELSDEIKQQKGDIEIDYQTPRGDWYYKSWKGDKNLSGGIATNIGIHLFDFITYCFGDPLLITKIYEDKWSMKGEIILKDRKVKFNLSTSPSEDPKRILSINGKNYDLSNGFTDLHTRSYIEIIEGNGWTVNECETSIRIVEELR